MKKLFDTVFGGIFAIAGILFFTVIGATIGGLVGEFTWGDHISPPLSGFVLGGIVGFAPPFYNFIVAPVQKRQQERRSAAQSRIRKRNDNAAAEVARMQNLATNIVANAGAAVRDFGSLPPLLINSKESASRAVSCYKDGAFSPFWSAIEQAYSSLGDYRSAAVRIEEAAQKHSTLIATYIRAGGNPTSISEFPVRVDSSTVTTTLIAASEDLGRMVYEAQKHPTFAQIWEQRRTTAAVVAGFANLEHAVNGMRAALTSAMYSLGESLNNSHSRVEFALSGMSSNLELASSQQAGAMQQLMNQASQIREQIYYQTWGHYPLL